MPMPLDVFWTLCKKLNRCYNKEWWDKNDRSILSWEDVEQTGYQQERLALAMRLVGWLETKDPESYEISFYDSY